MQYRIRKVSDFFVLEKYRTFRSLQTDKPFQDWQTISYHHTYELAEKKLKKLQMEGS